MAQRCTLLAAIENTSHFVWLLSFLASEGSHYIDYSHESASSRFTPWPNLRAQASGSPRHQKGKYCSAYVLPRWSGRSPGRLKESHSRRSTATSK